MDMWRLKITYRDRPETDYVEEEMFFEGPWGSGLEQAMACVLEYYDNVEEVIHVDISKISFTTFKKERVLNATKEEL